MNVVNPPVIKSCHSKLFILKVLMCVTRLTLKSTSVMSINLKVPSPVSRFLTPPAPPLTIFAFRIPDGKTRVDARVILALTTIVSQLAIFATALLSCDSVATGTWRRWVGGERWAVSARGRSSGARGAAKFGQRGCSKRTKFWGVGTGVTVGRGVIDGGLVSPHAQPEQSQLYMVSRMPRVFRAK